MSSKGRRTATVVLIAALCLPVRGLIGQIPTGSVAPDYELGLADAVQNRDAQTVHTLLERHVNVNLPQANGATAIHWAAHWDDLETANLLIQAGANVNTANDYGVTPLSLACTNRNTPMIKALLQAGANPNAALRTGETVLMTCARTGNDDALRTLLDHGADVNAKEAKKGQTALMWAVGQKHFQAVKVLIEHGADLHDRSNDGFTSLLFAARLGDLESTRLLLDAGADVNEAAPDGMNSLLMATASGHEALSLFLLDKGVDANSADINGYSALHYAVLKGLSTIAGLRATRLLAYLFRPNMTELVEALLRRSANPNAQIKKEGSYLPASDWIDPVGATPYFLAATSYDVNLMRMLVANGADPLLATQDGTTPLMAAVGMGLTRDRSGEEEKSALEAVKTAVELGANVNALDASGQAAIHAASFIGSSAVIEFLVNRGALLDVKDKYGMTPLSIAEGIIPPDLPVRNKRPRLARSGTADLLRKLGAEASARTPPVNATPESVPANSNRSFAGAN